MQDDEFTCDLFRFLQLLCEGHNSGLWAGFQLSQGGGNLKITIKIKDIHCSKFGSVHKIL